MVPLEPSDPTTGRTKHPNAEEAGQNDLKNNSMKMIETLKENMTLKRT